MLRISSMFAASSSSISETNTFVSKRFLTLRHMDGAISTSDTIACKKNTLSPA
jgi:hypothetical protein